jgi:hypothetical protein
MRKELCRARLDFKVRLMNLVFGEIGRTIGNAHIRGQKDESKALKRFVWLLWYVGRIGGRDTVFSKVL